jgi:hypothetical protein
MRLPSGDQWRGRARPSRATQLFPRYFYHVHGVRREEIGAKTTVKAVQSQALLRHSLLIAGCHKMRLLCSAWQA